MPKIFSSIFKYKKTLFFVFLFATIFSLIIPSIVTATGPVDGTPYAINMMTHYSPALANMASVKDLGNKIIVGLGLCVVGGAWKIAALSNILLSSVIANYMQKAITTDPNFLPSWAQMRDLANMVIVLGFVVIGVATALRIDGYGAKQLLWKLIGVALLVNFSGLFCGLIIDTTNIIIGGLVGAGGAGMMPSNVLERVLVSSQSILKADYSVANPFDFMATALLFGAIYLGIAFTFLYMTALLIARYAVLIILFILSPLAFAFWVYPASKKLWSEWWNAFLKWGFVGVIGSFVLMLSTMILKTLSFRTKTDFNDISISCTLVLIFLYVGFKMTSKSTGLAAMAGGAIMGLAKGAAGMAIGATVGTAALAGKMTGVSGVAQRAGQWTKDKATKAGEALNIVKKGTTDSNRADRLKEPMGRLDKITDNQQLAKIAEGRAATAEGAQNKAAAATILAKRNAFDTIDPTKREAAAKHAVAFGVAKDTFTKVRPETFTSPTKKEAVSKIRDDNARAAINTLGPSITPAGKENVLRAQKGLKPTTDEIRQAKSEMGPSKIVENALGVSPVTDRDINNKLIENKQKSLVEDAKSRGQIMLPEEATKLARKYKPTEVEKFETRETLSKEKVEKAFSKLDVGGIRTLPKEAVRDKGFIDNVALKNPKKIAKAAENMAQDKIDEVKKLKIDKSKHFADQTDEVKYLIRKIAALPAGSPERRAMAEKVNALQTELDASSYLR